MCIDCPSHSPVKWIPVKRLPSENVDGYRVGVHVTNRNVVQPNMSTIIREIGVDPECVFTMGSEITDRTIHVHVILLIMVVSCPSRLSAANHRPGEDGHRRKCRCAF